MDNCSTDVMSVYVQFRLIHKGKKLVHVLSLIEVPKIHLVDARESKQSARESRGRWAVEATRD